MRPAASDERVSPAGRFSPGARATLALILGLSLGVIAFISLLSDALSDAFIIGDFAQDYASAAAARDGEDPYGPLPELGHRYIDEPGDLFPGIEINPHPPARIALFQPMTALAYRAARIAWFVIGASALVASGVLLARAAGLSVRLAAASGTAVLLLPAAQLDLRLGHIDAVLLLLVTLTWLAVKRGAQAAAGIALGFAISIALFPAFLLVPLLRLRQIRAAGIAALTGLIATLIAAGSSGFASIGSYVTDAAPSNADRWTPDPQNISLVAIPLRWLRSTFWRPEAPDLPLLGVTLAGLLLVACAVAAYRTPATLSGDRFLAAIPWMLLASPIAWDHYLLIALPWIVSILVRRGRTLISSPAVLGVIGLILIARVPGLTVINPTTPLEAALWWALPGYALLLLAVFDARGSRENRSRCRVLPTGGRS